MPCPHVLRILTRAGIIVLAPIPMLMGADTSVNEGMISGMGGEALSMPMDVGKQVYGRKGN